MRRSPLIDFGAGNAPIVNDVNGNISREPEKGATLKRNVQLDQLKLSMTKTIDRTGEYLSPVTPRRKKRKSFYWIRNKQMKRGYLLAFFCTGLTAKWNCLTPQLLNFQEGTQLMSLTDIWFDAIEWQSRNDLMWHLIVSVKSVLTAGINIKVVSINAGQIWVQNSTMQFIIYR